MRQGSADEGRPSNYYHAVPSHRPVLSLQMPSFLPANQDSAAQHRQGRSFGWNGEDGSANSASSDGVSPCDSSRTTIQEEYTTAPTTTLNNNDNHLTAIPMTSSASAATATGSSSGMGRVSLTNTSPLKPRSRKSSTSTNRPERLVFHLHSGGDDTSGGEETSTSTESHHKPPHTAVEERATRPALSPYRFPSFSNSAPSLGLAKFPSLGPEPLTSGTRLDVPEGLSLHNADGSALLRLPLTPLEEVSPMMTLDSPANIVDSGINPFDRIKFNASSSSSSTTSLVQTPRADETFYHALLELVRTEDSYTADLTDLVEVRKVSPLTMGILG